MRKSIIIIFILIVFIAGMIFGYWYGITKFPATTEIKRPNYKIRVGE